MVKTWLTPAAKSISRRSMSLAHTVQRLVIHRGRLSVLVAALIAAVCLTACGSSSSSDPPLPSGTESISPSDSPTDPYSSPYETPTDPATYEPEPPRTTDQCAYAGDPLCPDTPITVPPPNLSPPY